MTMRQVPLVGVVMAATEGLRGGDNISDQTRNFMVRSAAPLHLIALFRICAEERQRTRKTMQMKSGEEGSLLFVLGELDYRINTSF